MLEAINMYFSVFYVIVNDISFESGYQIKVETYVGIIKAWKSLKIFSNDLYESIWVRMTAVNCKSKCTKTGGQMIAGR